MVEEVKLSLVCPMALGMKKILAMNSEFQHIQNTLSLQSETKLHHSCQIDPPLIHNIKVNSFKLLDVSGKLFRQSLT